MASSPQKQAALPPTFAIPPPPVPLPVPGAELSPQPHRSHAEGPFLEQQQPDSHFPEAQPVLYASPVIGHLPPPVEAGEQNLGGVRLPFQYPGTGSHSAASSEFGVATTLDELLQHQPSLARNLSVGHLSCGYLPERLNNSFGQLIPASLQAEAPAEQETPAGQQRPHRHSIDLSALMRQIAKRKNSANFSGKLNTSFEFYPRTPTTLEPRSSAAATYSGNVLSIDSERENLVASPHSELEETKGISRETSPIKKGAGPGVSSFFIKVPPIWDVESSSRVRGRPIHLNIDFFKTQPCTVPYQHNHKHCPYFHSNKDKRRPPSQFTYSSEMCKFAEQELSCRDQCELAHNRVERLYHPDKYKSKFCTHYPHHLAQCEYDDFCCFAHSEKDIKVPLLHLMHPKDMDFYLFHFKTSWCPFTKDHNKAQCVYAHNWQDFRRKPHIFNYDAYMCPNWKSGTFIMAYQEGCPLQWRCEHSHGWKQKEFHPHNYKTEPCPYKRNSRSCPGRHQYFVECPFYHDGGVDQRGEGELYDSTFNIHRVQPRERDDISWEKDWIIAANNVNAQRQRSREPKQKQPNSAHLRRFSLDFTREERKRFSTYFKPFENAMNLLYFDLDKKEELQRLEPQEPSKQFSPLITGMKFTRKHSLDFFPGAFSLDSGHETLNKSLAMDDTGVDDLLKETGLREEGREQGGGEEEEEEDESWERVLEDV